jgi:hypothetical protein
MAYFVDAATNQQRGMKSTSADDVKFFLLMLFLRGKKSSYGEEVDSCWVPPPPQQSFDL